MSFIKFDYTDFNSNVSKVPTFKANLSAGATLNKWRYGLSIISVGETTLPGFSYTDITLNYDLDKSSSIFTKIHNLFNTDYETVNGYTVGVGLAQETGNGGFWRLEGTYSDYEDADFNGTLLTEASASVRNKVNAELEAVALRFSIGKQF